MAPRTTHRSSRGTKLYAVRDKSGKFKDIQTYKRVHGIRAPVRAIQDAAPPAAAPPEITIKDAPPKTSHVCRCASGGNRCDICFGPIPRRLLDGMTSAERKLYPLCTGLLDYFPDALAEVANISFRGNEKHNPGQPMHHARGKSMDHADCCARHLTERGGFDPDGNRHSAQLAWRALALLQEELEAEKGLSLPRAARAPEVTATVTDFHIPPGRLAWRSDENSIPPAPNPNFSKR